MAQNWLNVGLQPTEAAFYRGRPISLDDPDIYGPVHPRVEGMNIRDCIQAIIQVIFRTSGVVSSLAAASDLNNEVYLVTLRRTKDSPLPQQVQFRVATENKILLGISIDSEVSTLTFLREKTLVHAPRVFAYCTNGNLFGLSFLVVEHIVLGQRLSDVYESLNQRSRLRLAHECASILAELSLREWPKIGCLRSGVKAPINGVRFPTLREPPRSTGIYVGPLDSNLTDEDKAELPEDFPSDNGPFSRTEYWLQALCTEHDAFLAYLVATDRYDHKEAEQTRIELRLILQRAKTVLQKDHYAGHFSLYLQLRPDNIRIFDRGPQMGQIAAVTNVEGAFVGPMWYSVVFPRWLKGVDGEQDQFRRIFEDTYEKKTTTTKGSLKALIADPRYRELRQITYIIKNPTPEALENCVTLLARQGLLTLATTPAQPPAPPPKQASQRSGATTPAGQRSATPSRAPPRPSTPKLTSEERAKALGRSGYATDAPKKPRRDAWPLFGKKQQQQEI